MSSYSVAHSSRVGKVRQTIAICSSAHANHSKRKLDPCLAPRSSLLLQTFFRAFQKDVPRIARDIRKGSSFSHCFENRVRPARGPSNPPAHRAFQARHEVRKLFFACVAHAPRRRSPVCLLVSFVEVVRTFVVALKANKTKERRTGRMVAML